MSCVKKKVLHREDKQAVKIHQLITSLGSLNGRNGIFRILSSLKELS